MGGWSRNYPAGWSSLGRCLRFFRRHVAWWCLATPGPCWSFERQDVRTPTSHPYFNDCFLTELAAALGTLQGLLEVSDRWLVGFQCTIVTVYKAWVIREIMEDIILGQRHSHLYHRIAKISWLVLHMITITTANILVSAEGKNKTLAPEYNVTFPHHETSLCRTQFFKSCPNHTRIAWAPGYFSDNTLFPELIIYALNSTRAQKAAFRHFRH